MNSGIYEAMIARMDAMEKRIAELEKKMEEPETVGGVADRLRRKYPIAMTKKDAAKELGVTRATIYTMIQDGRLQENGWRKVITQSVIDLMTKSAHMVRTKRGNRWAKEEE